MPNSVQFLSLSYIGQAEKRTFQPFGISLLNGSPAPPPVLSPTTVTFGQQRIYFTNSLAALKTFLLVNTITFFCQRTPLDGSRYCSLISEKSLCPVPVLCCIYPTSNFSLVKRAANFSALVIFPPLLLRTSITKPLHSAR